MTLLNYARKRFSSSYTSSSPPIEPADGSVVSTPPTTPPSSQYQPSKRSIRHTSLPSQHIRQSRRFSLPCNPSINLNQQLIQDNIHPALIPIINIFNAYQVKTFATLKGDFSIDGNVWDIFNLKLFGNELYLFNTEKSTYINLIDSNIELCNGSVIKINNLNKVFFLRLTADNYIKFVSAFNLSRYEYISLNESYTAVILSIKGSKLFDIKTLLSNINHNRTEWVNIKIPTISSKYVKLLMIIYPNKSKKNGTIKFFTESKSFRSKKLVCSIENVDNVYNLFPEVSSNQVINLNSLIKINGDITVHKKYMHLFMPPTTKSKKIKISRKDKFIKTTFMYLLPEEHPSVTQIETMIRIYLPIITSFKLYGKPQKLISNKKDPKSLLFGLPLLPNINYISSDDSDNLTTKHLNQAMAKNWSDVEWRNCYKKFLEGIIEGYDGCGNLYDCYIDENELEFNDEGFDENFEIIDDAAFSGIEETEETEDIVERSASSSNYGNENSNAKLNIKTVQEYSSTEPSPVSVNHQFDNYHNGFNDENIIINNSSNDEFISLNELNEKPMMMNENFNENLPLNHYSNIESY